MGMTERDQLDDKLANGSTTKIAYHVEVNGNDCRGWRRNFVDHSTYEEAKQMAGKFTRLAQVRIVRVELTEAVVTA